MYLVPPRPLRHVDSAWLGWGIARVSVLIPGQRGEDSYERFSAVVPACVWGRR
jgi:hypothetical protein